METIQEKFFKTLSNEEFLKHIDNFIDELSKESDKTKESFMYQFNYFSDELKRRGL